MSRKGPAGLTRRAVLLGLVVCALVLSLAYPIKEYVGQRGQIAALEQTAREQSARLAALHERQRQLDDPAYVQAQARERLRYVMPGDRVYVVVERAGSSAPAAKAPSSTSTETGGSWLERLGESVQRADSG